MKMFKLLDKLEKKEKVYKSTVASLNPYIGNTFFLICAIVLLYGLIKGLSRIQVNIVKYIIVAVTSFCGIYSMFILVRGTIVYGENIILREDRLLAFNRFRIKIWEIEYSSVKKIYSTKGVVLVVLEDYNKKKMKINVLVEDIEGIINTIITKSTNCEYINLDCLKERCPGFSIYKKG